MLTAHISDALVDSLILEDCPYGDLTTEILGISDTAGTLAISPRRHVTLAGVVLAARVLEHCGCFVRVLAREGTSVPPGTAVLEAEGSARALHRGWKVAQNCLEYMSGIATRASAIAAEAGLGRPGCQVAVTRKNFPGTKRMSLAAATAGGCVVHRAGLSETILVFDRHRLFLTDTADDGKAGIAALITQLPRLRRGAPERALTVEVDNVDDGVALAAAGVDAVQFDKLPLDDLPTAVAAVHAANPATRVIAAGGITATNARQAAASGADLLVTSWPYFGRPQDMLVTMHRL